MSSQDVPTPAVPSGSWRDRLVVIAMTVTYASSFYQRVAVPGVLFAAIQSDMQCSATAVTGLASIYLSIYAPGQFLTGYLADRFGGARVMVVGGLLLSLGALGFPLSTNLPWLYGLRALVAVGATVMYLCTLRELASRFDASAFSKLVGPVMFMGGLGGMLGTGPTAWLAQPLGWRGALLVAGGFTLAAWLALVAVLRGAPAPRRPIEPISWHVGRQALFNPRIAPLYLTCATVFVVYFLFQAVIGAKYLQDVLGCGEVMASNVTLAMQLLSMAVMLMCGTIAGWFAQRRRPTIRLQVGLIVAGVAVLLLSLWWRAPLAAHAAGLLLLALGNGLMPLAVCAMREVSPASAVAMSIAVSNGITYIAVALASNGSGMVLDAFGSAADGGAVRYPPQAYAWVLAGLAVLSLAAMAAAVRFREPTVTVTASP